jgi:DnaJ-class molecular chaperone
MLDDQCPICGGKGKALSQRHYNKVSGGTPVEQECWLCDGKGVIVKQETKHALMNKYWKPMEMEGTNKG